MPTSRNRSPNGPGGRGPDQRGQDGRGPDGRDRDRDRERREPPPAPDWSKVPADQWLPPEFVELFEGDETSTWYFYVWDRAGKVLQKSPLAPDSPFPNLFLHDDQLPLSEARFRGEDREVVHVTSGFGIHVLVGRSIERDLAMQRRGGLVQLFSGLGVLAVGLAGGWMMSGRAIRPITRITETARTISAANLSQRIDPDETETELGQLALVLNQTFDRLQRAFQQQTRFTADASHELRTPLAVILAEADLTLSRVRSAGEYQEALKGCQRAARRMRSLIEQLLVLARFDSDRPDLEQRWIDLAELTQETVDLLRPLASERNITIETRCRPTPVSGDYERLVQVVTNLVTNAVRYSHLDGHVLVTVEPSPSGQAVLRVIDQGIGIPAEHLPHIFERFYRVDAARTHFEGGTGLGLSICQSLVAAHGGTIQATSQDGAGTTIEVRLCSAVEPAPETSEPARAVSSDQQGLTR